MQSFLKNDRVVTTSVLSIEEAIHSFFAMLNITSPKENFKKLNAGRCEKKNLLQLKSDSMTEYFSERLYLSFFDTQNVLIDTKAK